MVLEGFPWKNWGVRCWAAFELNYCPGYLVPAILAFSQDTGVKLNSVFGVYKAYPCGLFVRSFLCLLQNRQWSDEAAEMWSEPVLTNSHYSTSSLQRLDLNIASGARVSCSVTRDGCIAALPHCNPRTQEKTLLCCMSQCQFINVKFVQSLLMVIIRSNQSK